MNSERYQLKSEEEFTRFEFISEGPRGVIRKFIEFQETTQPSVFNLAFGDLDPDTGLIDDLRISNNADTERVLQTVVATL